MIDAIATMQDIKNMILEYANLSVDHGTDFMMASLDKHKEIPGNPVESVTIKVNYQTYLTGVNEATLIYQYTEGLKILKTFEVALSRYFRIGSSDLLERSLNNIRENRYNLRGFTITCEFLIVTSTKV